MKNMLKTYHFVVCTILTACLSFLSLIIFSGGSVYGFINRWLGLVGIPMYFWDTIGTLAILAAAKWSLKEVGDFKNN